MSKLLERVLVFINRRLCRHRNTIRKFGPNRVYLACCDCPWESPGFIIDERV